MLPGMVAGTGVALQSVGGTSGAVLQGTSTTLHEYHRLATPLGLCGLVPATLD